MSDQQHDPATPYYPGQDAPKQPRKKPNKWALGAAGVGALIILASALGGGHKSEPAAAVEAPAATATATATATPKPARTAAPEPVHTPTKAAPALDGNARPLPGSGALPDAVYVSWVRTRTTTLTTVGDGAIVDMALSACGAFNRGGTKEQVIAAVMEAGNPSMQRDFATVVGAGVSNYCSQHSHLF